MSKCQIAREFTNSKLQQPFLEIVRVVSPIKYTLPCQMSEGLYGVKHAIHDILFSPFLTPVELAVRLSTAVQLPTHSYACVKMDD